MEPFKNLYNKKSISKLASVIKEVHPQFDDSLFVKDVMKGLQKLEMKDRVKKISALFSKHLSSSYKKNISIPIKEYFIINS